MSRWMDDSVEGYLTGLAETEHDDLGLVEMETLAAERDFPIVGRATGRYLELAACMVGARRSWSSAAGTAIRRTGSPGCRPRRRGDLYRRLGRQRGQGGALPQQGWVWTGVRYRVGDALTGFAAEEGEFDIVYCASTSWATRLLDGRPRAHPGRRTLAVRQRHLERTRGDRDRSRGPGGRDGCHRARCCQRDVVPRTTGTSAASSRSGTAS